MALTDIAVKSSKPKEKAYKLSDGDGLYLFISPAGGKLWRYDYAFNGTRKTLTLGKYPIMTLQEAREAHLQARKNIAKGIDPSDLKKQAKADSEVNNANTFAVWANQWLGHWRVDKAPRHVDIISRRLATNILPVIGAMPILNITAVAAGHLVVRLSPARSQPRRAVRANSARAAARHMRRSERLWSSGTLSWPPWPHRVILGSAKAAADHSRKRAKPDTGSRSVMRLFSTALGSA